VLKQFAEEAVKVKALNVTEWSEGDSPSLLS
jgi:hypothetical protein